MIMDRNGKDLRGSEEIKQRQQEYTEELYKKGLNDQDNHNGVITHLEPDILECKVKWALESITRNKASGGKRIPVELFQILKDDAVKVLHSICQKVWKTQQWPQDWKRSVFIPIKKKGNAKECSNYCTVVLISHENPSSEASAVHELRNSRCTSWIQKRQRNQRSNCQHSLNHRESKGIPEKNCFCFIDYTKAFDCVNHNKLWKILRDGNTRPPYLSPEKPICWSRSNSQN